MSPSEKDQHTVFSEANRNWTAEQMAKIDEWLTSKWGEKKLCTQCEVSAWGVGAAPASVPLSSNDARIIYAGGHYPCIVVTCNNCGNTILVNALVAGIQALLEGKEAANG